MQPRSPDLPLTIGIIAGAVTLAAGADAPPPDRIKLTPRGAATTRDGRSYSFDPAALAARFKTDGIRIPIDTDHSTVLLGAQGQKPNTVGFVTAVEAADDGTHGRVEWLDPAQAAAQLRTHPFVSPTFHHDAAGHATWLHSVALVSAPALSMPALAHAHQGTPMKQIAKALGLAETATEDECVAALAARIDRKPLAVALGLPDTADAQACLTAIGTLRQADKTPIVAELQATLQATRDRLTAVEKTARDKDVTDLLEGALKARKIVPAQRDSYVLLCATDEGLKNVRAMLAATPEGLQGSNLDTLALPGDGAIDPVKLGAQARALVDKRHAEGIVITVADAVAELTAKKG